MDRPAKIAQSHFELSTYQKRLRHLRCLALRNLCWPGHKGKDLTALQSYFTLHVDQNSASFYKSEKIQGSLNPSWQSFDISRYEDAINTRSRCLVVKVWVGIKDRFDLLIDWDVNLMGLVYFADKLQHDSVKHGTNSLIFGMFDKYFIAPEANLAEVHKPELVGNVMTVDQSAVRNSYRTTSLSRIYTVLRATKQTQATVNKFYRCIEDKLLSSQEKAQKLSNREALLLKRAQMRQELEFQMAKVQDAKDDYDKMKIIQEQKRTDILEKFKQLKKRRDELSESKRSYHQTRESFIKEEAQWKIRRKQLIGELATYVYPITENQKSDSFICNVKLPDSESFQGCDDTQIAVALGYTAHMVLMMSHILDVPLRYPIEHRSSRTLIKDHIHHKLTEKDNTFPLYSKGKEKFYFNYGVYLLNKNIGQLRFYCGMGTADLRTTLQNIKTLLELRLGTKVDAQNRLKKPHSDHKEKNPSDIDTQSSLASGGRFSAPDSADMLTLDNVLAEDRGNKVRSEKDSFTNLTYLNSNSNRQVEDTGSGDISFNPSPEDNFFKISMPVSNKNDILNSIEALDTSLKLTELANGVEQDSQMLQFEASDSLDENEKPRTDSNLSNEFLGGKNMVLEHQISTMSETEYHQQHSNFKKFLSIGVSGLNSENSSEQNSANSTSQGTVDETSEEKSSELVDQADSLGSPVVYDKIPVIENHIEHDGSESDLCNNTDKNMSENHQDSETCDDTLNSSVPMATEDDYPEFQRTFKTLSMRQTDQSDDTDHPVQTGKEP